MSYTKSTIDLDARLQRLAVTRATEHELRDRAELEELERLRRPPLGLTTLGAVTR